TRWVTLLGSAGHPGAKTGVEEKRAKATSDKEKELWVKLKRLYEPDVEDQMWTHTQALMHDPVE
nr:hypothetical protein [Tanacetum cinerariifolium]GEZ21731.1 hypothetical protein [Tanacetum cinerariifolium]